MKYKSAASLMLTLVALAAGFVAAEAQTMQTQTFDAGKVVMIPGVDALVMLEGEMLEVHFVAPPQQRDKAYRDVDLKAGDVLVMLNGKRIKGVEDLRDRIESLEIGDEMKFGIKRGAEMKLVAFDKAEADQEGGPKMMVMTMSVDEGDSAADPGAGGPMVRKMTFSPEDGLLIMEAGVMIADEDDAVTVKAVLPISGGAGEAADVDQGDRVVSFNGTNITSMDQLRKLYETLSVDGEFTLVFNRDGEQHSVTYTKAERGGPQIIKAGRNEK